MCWEWCLGGVPGGLGIVLGGARHGAGRGSATCFGGGLGATVACPGRCPAHPPATPSVLPGPHIYRRPVVRRAPPAAPPRRPRPWGDGARPRARLATVLAAVAGPRSPPGALGGWAGGSRDFFKKIFLSPTDRHFCAPRVAHFVWAKTPCTDHPHSKPLPPENFFGT